MKKSKIIVPALGILCLSTAATVTGTVAWFTASRVRTISMDNITVVNPESGLKLTTVTNVENTYVDADKVVHHGYETASGSGYLRDGSVDMSETNPVLYKAIVNDTIGQAVGYATQTMGTPDTKKIGNVNVYYATEFNVTFEASNNDSTVDNAIFFDSQLSYATLDSAAADIDAYKALRIGLRSDKGQWMVWAPFTADSTIKNVNGALAAGAEVEGKWYEGGDTTKTEYASLEAYRAQKEEAIASEDCVIGNNTKAAAADSNFDEGSAGYLAASKKDAPEFMGIINAGASQNQTLTVSVYTWFEGTDSNCEYEDFAGAAGSVVSGLTFISRKVAQA